MQYTLVTCLLSRAKRRSSTNQDLSNRTVCGILSLTQAVGSGVERFLDTEEVSGSNPLPPIVCFLSATFSSQSQRFVSEIRKAPSALFVPMTRLFLAASTTGRVTVFSALISNRRATCASNRCNNRKFSTGGNTLVVPDPLLLRLAKICLGNTPR